MLVKTHFNTIVNIAEFDKIEIRYNVKSQKTDNVYHIIEAVSESATTKIKPLAQFYSADMQDKAQKAYDDLFSALLSKETAFDMTQYSQY